MPAGNRRRVRRPGFVASKKTCRKVLTGGWRHVVSPPPHLRERRERRESIGASLPPSACRTVWSAFSSPREGSFTVPARCGNFWTVSGGEERRLNRAPRGFDGRSGRDPGHRRAAGEGRRFTDRRVVSPGSISIYKSFGFRKGAGALRFFTESLILAQNERWRRV